MLVSAFRLLSFLHTKHQKQQDIYWVAVTVKKGNPIVSMQLAVVVHILDTVLLKALAPVPVSDT